MLAPLIDERVYAKMVSVVLVVGVATSWDTMCWLRTRGVYAEMVSVVLLVGVATLEHHSCFDTFKRCMLWDGRTPRPTSVCALSFLSVVRRPPSLGKWVLIVFHWLVSHCVSHRLF